MALASSSNLVIVSLLASPSASTCACHPPWPAPRYAIASRLTFWVVVLESGLFASTWVLSARSAFTNSICPPSLAHISGVWQKKCTQRFWLHEFDFTLERQEFTRFSAFTRLRSAFFS